MADYSEFPFETCTVEEIFHLFRESVDIGDDDFANACKEAIKKQKHLPIVADNNQPKQEAVVWWKG